MSARIADIVLAKKVATSVKQDADRLLKALNEAPDNSETANLYESFVLSYFNIPKPKQAAASGAPKRKAMKK